MKFIELPLKSTKLYEKGIPGNDLIRIYGDEFAPIIYEYMKTSDPIVFDKNKEKIKEYYKKFISQGKHKQETHVDLFFYRLKKIISLTDEFKKSGSWKNPIVIRDSYNGKDKVVSVGLDRWHIMNNFGIKKYEFLYLSNIEFSSDFKPKLETLFTSGTTFDFNYDDHTSRYKFTIKNNLTESPNFNLKQWLNTPYIEGHPSAIVSQPNRVSLRDAAIKKLQRR
jgi:hypothetical protein